MRDNGRSKKDSEALRREKGARWDEAYRAMITHMAAVAAAPDDGIHRNFVKPTIPKRNKLVFQDGAYVNLAGARVIANLSRDERELLEICDRKEEEGKEVFFVGPRSAIHGPNSRDAKRNPNIQSGMYCIINKTPKQGEPAHDPLPDGRPSPMWQVLHLDSI